MTSPEAIAERMGLTVEQVKEVLASAEGGTWTTTARRIITHYNGKRHWSSEQCEQCEQN